MILSYGDFGGEKMEINYKGFMREMIQRHPVTIGPEAFIF